MADISKIIIPSGTYNFKDSRVSAGTSGQNALFYRSPYPTNSIGSLSGHTVTWYLGQWGTDYYLLGYIDNVQRVAIPIDTCFAKSNSIYLCKS